MTEEKQSKVRKYLLKCRLYIIINIITTLTKDTIFIMVNGRYTFDVSVQLDFFFFC